MVALPYSGTLDSYNQLPARHLHFKFNMSTAKLPIFPSQTSLSCSLPKISKWQLNSSQLLRSKVLESFLILPFLSYFNLIHKQVLSPVPPRYVHCLTMFSRPLIIIYHLGYCNSLPNGFPAHSTAF